MRRRICNIVITDIRVFPAEPFALQLRRIFQIGRSILRILTVPDIRFVQFIHEGFQDIQSLLVIILVFFRHCSTPSAQANPSGTSCRRRAEGFCFAILFFVLFLSLLRFHHCLELIPPFLRQTEHIQTRCFYFHAERFPELFIQLICYLL